MDKSSTEKLVTPYWNKKHSKYAVIIHSAMGPGWSTWNYKELAYDSRVVEYIINHKKDEEWVKQFTLENRIKRYSQKPEPHDAVYDFRKFLESIGYEGVYVTDIRELKIIWVDKGRRWKIMDVGEGAEEITFADETDWISFE